eukprot:766469-Hanusia_phi.AAC.1
MLLIAAETLPAVEGRNLQMPYVQQAHEGEKRLMENVARLAVRRKEQRVVREGWHNDKGEKDGIKVQKSTGNEQEQDQQQENKE